MAKWTVESKGLKIPSLESSLAWSTERLRAGPPTILIPSTYFPTFHLLICPSHPPQISLSDFQIRLGTFRGIVSVCVTRQQLRELSVEVFQLWKMNFDTDKEDIRHKFRKGLTNLLRNNISQKCLLKAARRSNSAIARPLGLKQGQRSEMFKTSQVIAVKTRNLLKTSRKNEAKPEQISRKHSKLKNQQIGKS